MGPRHRIIRSGFLFRRYTTTCILFSVEYSVPRTLQVMYPSDIYSVDLSVWSRSRCSLDPDPSKLPVWAWRAPGMTYVTALFVYGKLRRSTRRVLDPTIAFIE